IATLQRMPEARAKLPPALIAAWLLTAALLVLVLAVHLVPALFAGLLVYELVHLASPALSRLVSGHRAKVIVVTLLAVVVIGAVAAVTFALIVFVQSDPDRPAALLGQFADLVLRAKDKVPAWLGDFLPGSAEEVNSMLADWARGHAGDLEL